MLTAKVAAAEHWAATEENECLELSWSPGGGGLDDDPEALESADSDQTINDVPSCRRRGMPGLSTAVRNGWRDPKLTPETITPERRIADEIMGVAEKDLGRPLPQDAYGNGDCRGYIRDRPRAATEVLRLTRSPGGGGLGMDFEGHPGSTPRQWMRARPHPRGRATSRARQSHRGRRRRASTARDDGGESGPCDGPGNGRAVARGPQAIGGAR